MKFGVLGRRAALIRSAEVLIQHGHKLMFVQTTREEDFYDATVGDFKRLAEQNSCEFRDAKIMDKDSLASTEVVISHNWKWLVSEEYLNLNKFGILNAHPGDLPRYRGNACLNWAIINAEPEVALTIHKMDKNLDSGPIVAKNYYKIGDRDLQDLYRWMDAEMPVMFLESLSKLDKQGEDALMPQSQTRTPLRCYPRVREDSKINWFQNSETIVRLVRASTLPLPGAYTYDQSGNLFRILSARSANVDFDYLAQPGSIVDFEGSGVIVSTSEGLVLTQDIYLNDFSKAETIEFLRANQRTRFR